MQLLTIIGTIATSANLHQRAATTTSALTTLAGTSASIPTNITTDPLASISTPAPTSTSSCDPNTPYADCTASKTFTPPTAHFSPTIPATLRVDAAEASALLSAFSSCDSTWTAGPQYPGLKAAVYEAAPTSAQLSLAVNGYSWDAIVRSDWYSRIPGEWQDVIVRQENALETVFENITAGHGLISGGRSVVWGDRRERREVVVVMVGLVAITAAFIGIW